MHALCFCILSFVTKLKMRLSKSLWPLTTFLSVSLTEVLEGVTLFPSSLAISLSFTAYFNFSVSSSIFALFIADIFSLTVTVMSPYMKKQSPLLLQLASLCWLVALERKCTYLELSSQYEGSVRWTKPEYPGWKPNGQPCKQVSHRLSQDGIWIRTTLQWWQANAFIFLFPDPYSSMWCFSSHSPAHAIILSSFFF